MKLNDLLVFSLRNLSRRKLRTFLTILSIVIGTFFIILMISFGFGMQRANNQMIENMGGLTNITVRSPYIYDSNMGNSNDKSKILNDAKVNSFESMDKVKAVLPIIEINSGNILVKNYESYVSLKGVDLNRMEQFGYKVEEGRNLNPKKEFEFIFSNIDLYDNKTGEIIDNIDILKEKVVYRIGWKDVQSEFETGKKTYYDFNLKPVGKFTGGDYYSPEILVNYKTAKKLFISEKELNLYGENVSNNKINEKDIPYTYIMVKANNLEDVKPLQDEFEKMGYNTSSNLEFNESMQKQVRQIQLVFGAIGAVALLVSAIGIANTMIMSIYERTKEIGIMKVVGASIKNIRDIFLIESTLVGLIGGILGIMLSVLVSFILNKFLFEVGADSMSESGISSYIPVWLMILSAIFSALIGLISGLLPAVRATKISVIDAIRTE